MDVERKKEKKREGRGRWMRCAMVDGCYDGTEKGKEEELSIGSCRALRLTKSRME